RLDLGAVAHDAGVGHEPCDVLVAEGGDVAGLEAGERLPEGRALAEDRDPAEPRLEALQAQLLEERPVAVQRTPPFLVVIAAVLDVGAGPRTSHDAVGDEDVRAHPVSLRRAGDRGCHRPQASAAASVMPSVTSPDLGTQP